MGNRGEAPAGRAVPLAKYLSRKTSLYLDCHAPAIRLSGKKLAFADGREIELAELRRVILIGRANVDALILYGLVREGISVDWLDRSGNPIGQIQPLARNADFCVENQITFHNSAAALELAKRLILAKVDNCHEIIRRRAPEYNVSCEARRNIQQAKSAESLRGYEGSAAREYFQAWTGRLHRFEWQGRKPHPAPDPVNMLLSTGYGLLRNRLASALSSCGLNPRMGFFHETRGRHCALASDLMEPLRCLVDGRVLTLLRKQELAPESFSRRGALRLCRSGRLCSHSERV